MLRVSEQDLETGYLGMDGDGMRDGAAAGKKGERCTCNLPVIREPEAFKDNIYETWLSVPESGPVSADKINLIVNITF